MTTVFHTQPYGRFVVIQSNLRRKKLHRNQGSNFLGRSFGNRGNVRLQSSLEEKVNHSILKGEFSQRIDPSSIFTSIAPVLLDWSNKTSWVFPALKSASYCLPQPIMSRSDSSSEANSSCCYRSDG